MKTAQPQKRQWGASIRLCEECGHSIEEKSFQLVSEKCPQCGSQRIRKIPSKFLLFLDAVWGVVGFAVTFTCGLAVGRVVSTFLGPVLRQITGDANAAVIVGTYVFLLSAYTFLLCGVCFLPGASGRMVLIQQEPSMVGKERNLIWLRLSGIVPMLGFGAFCIELLFTTRILLFVMLILWALIFGKWFSNRIVQSEWRYWESSSEQTTSPSPPHS